MEAVQKIVPQGMSPILTLVGLIAIFCLGVGITTYAWLSMTNQAPPSDATLTKNLDVFQGIVNPAPLTCPSDNLLTDYYVAGSGYSMLSSKTVYSYITADAITKVIAAGARVIDLHVYEVNKKPVVGIADEATGKMLTYNTIPLEDCCNVIASNAFATTTPFIMSIVFHTDDTVLINNCADIMKNTLRKYMLDSSYSYQRKNLALEPACNLMGKLIVVSGEKHKGTAMDELVNISWSSSLCRRLTYTQAAQTYDHDELTEYNKRNITLVVPDLDTSSMANQSAEICFSYGCQWVLMNYGSLDNALEIYIGKFVDSSFIVKPEPLRYKPVTYTAPKPQNPNVSFQPKQLSSPLFDTTIGSVR
uniref:phosphoinositide phospholipase C n=1 Tax=viral metagenome TaxID=1070528 RepID=A0A6C0I6K3_9ZZZZ